MVRGVILLALGIIVGLSLYHFRDHLPFEIPQFSANSTAEDGPKLPPFDVEDYFPNGWADINDDCQDTRTEALIALGLDVVLSEDTCTVLSGTWIDSFSGELLSGPEAVVITYVVPLEIAHKSGAHEWKKDRRIAFANDLVRTGDFSLSPQTALGSNIIITGTHSRGASDISQWVPNKAKQRCDYALRWLAVKTLWRLELSEDEHFAISDILRTCALTPERKRQRLGLPLPPLPPVEP